MKFKESISALKRDLLYTLQERMSNLVNSLKGGKRWGAENPRIRLVFSCPGGQITGTLQVRRKNQKAFKIKCKMGSILATVDLGETTNQHLFGSKIVSRAGPPCGLHGDNFI